MYSSFSSGKNDVIIAIAHVEFNPAPMPPKVCARKLSPTNNSVLSINANEPRITSYITMSIRPNFNPLGLPILFKFLPVITDEIIYTTANSPMINPK